jgi:prepilin-type N-terminal cleavage/methylation domain-containing protein
MYCEKNTSRLQKGYTVVELMVALVVSTIVLAGSMAGFNVIQNQYGLVDVKLKMDRAALDWISQLQKDISMVGFKDYNHATSISSGEAFVWDEPPFDADPSNSVQSGFFMTYDDYDNSGAVYRKGVHYQCNSKSAISGVAEHHQCEKYTGKCLASPCTTWNDVAIFERATKATTFPMDEATIDFVKEFSITRMATQTTGTLFLGVPQVLKFKLVLLGLDKRNLISSSIEKTYHFVVKANNISLVKVE